MLTGPYALRTSLDPTCVACKQNATIPPVFHESIAILLRNAPIVKMPREALEADFVEMLNERAKNINSAMAGHFGPWIRDLFMDGNNRA